MSSNEIETPFFWRLSRVTAQFLAKDPQVAVGEQIDGDSAVEWLDELGLFVTLCDAPALRARAQRLYERLAAWLASAGIAPAF